MKKTAAVFLICLSMLFSAVTVFADYNGVTAGDFEKVFWEAKDGVLTLSGNGEVSAQEEWNPIREDIQKIVIEKDIFSIEDDCFEGFKNLREVVFNGSPLMFGNPFKGCTNIKIFRFENWQHFKIDDDIELEAVYYNGSKEQWKETLSGTVYGDMLPLYKAEIHCADGIIEGRSTIGGIKDGIEWSFENGVFSLSGEGKFSAYDIYGFNDKMTKFIAKGNIMLSDTLSMHNNLKEVILPDCVTEMDEQFFFGCTSLEKVKLPENLETLNIGMFHETALKSINVPAKTKKVETAGWDAESLENIYVDEANESLVSSDGVLFSKDMSELIKYPSSKQNAVYTVPEGVKRIAPHAFRLCRNLEEVIFPESLEEIGDSAFESAAKLKSVQFNSGVQIGSMAFFGTEKLKELNIKEESKLSMGSFGDCGVEKVTLPKDLAEIPSYCFQNCTFLKSINLNNVKVLRKSAFIGCTSLEKVKLTSLESWEGMPSDGADTETGKVGVADMVCLSDYAPFFGCTALKEVYISFKGAPEEPGAMFIQCPSLETVVIENLNFEMNKWEFYGTEGESMHMQYETYAGGMKSYYSIQGGRKVTALPEKMVLYGDENVRAYSEKIGAEYGYLATNAEYEAFRGNKDIKYLYVGDSVKNVGICAFADTSIESVLISESVEKLDKWAFAGSKNLKKIVIEEGGNPEIDGSAFYDISPNADIYIPSSVISLPDTIFRDWMIDENGSEIWLDAKYGNIRLYVPSGSYAERFAEENGLKYSIVISIYIDGKVLQSGSAILENGRTLIPLRAVGEAMGADVSWDDERKTAIACKDGVTAEFPVGENAVYVNGEKSVLDTAAIIEHDRTMIPLRALAEAFGANVNWDDETKSVLITFD